MKREKVFFVLLSLQVLFCILTFSQKNKVKSNIVSGTALL